MVLINQEKNPRGAMRAKGQNPLLLHLVLAGGSKKHIHELINQQDQVNK